MGTFKQMKRYNEDRHWDEPSIDADSGNLIDVDEKDNKEKELRKKLRENVRTLFAGLNIPTPDPKQVNWHIGFYQTLIERGWSHEQIATELIHTVGSDTWKERRENGEYPVMNTVEYNLRNKDPKKYGRS